MSRYPSSLVADFVPLPPLPVVAVHGFMYDPEDHGGPNDPRPWFADMAGITGREVIGFAWYSCPFGFRVTHPVHSLLQSARAWLAAWARGYLHPYRDAWDRAWSAAGRLAELIAAQPGPVDLVAHSLGVRVSLLAMERLALMGQAGKVRRVVFFNGAELARNVAARAVRCKGTEFLNIVVRNDRVLGLLGSRFSGEANGPCIGQVGLQAERPTNWRDLVLDDPGVMERAHRLFGWTLRGDDPGEGWSHGESYTFAGNCDPVRAFLAGAPFLGVLFPPFRGVVA